jgi:three-Cys-motif partner protein
MTTRKGPNQQFGGDWTQQKLDILRDYLAAYSTILSKYQFNFAYIDAFAGTGYRTASESDQPENLDLLGPPTDQDSQCFLEGSASLALTIKPNFPTLIFIEKSASKLATLKDLVATQYADRKVIFKEGDANAALRSLCSEDWTRRRAVLFLDPFGMQIEWSTLEAIAATKAIDLWVLFPIGVAVNRMLVRRGNIPTEWRDRLDKLFGTAEWYDAFYQPSRNRSLFDDEESGLEKNATFDSISRYFSGRLASVFAKVATTPALLKNSKGNPLYALFFAAANPRGSVTAVKIANDILRKFNHG